MIRHEVIVVRIERHAPDVVTVYFTLGDGRLINYTAGQYVTVFFDGTSTREGKAYSLCTAPHEPWMGITVKKIGEYSGRLHALRVGDSFHISDAYGFFNPNTERPLVCLGAGVGIGPIWSVLKEELRLHADRAAELFYTNKREADIAHIDAIGRAAASHPNFVARHHITRQQEVPPTMSKGRIVLDECVADAKDAIFLVCGSVDFVRSMVCGLSERGVESARISTETFFES